MNIVVEQSKTLRSRDLHPLPRRRLVPALPTRLQVPVIIALAVGARLPFLAHPLGSDEAGLFLLGGQWQPGLGSIYGAYWVDRPPLIVAIFGLAHFMGGVVGLRILGCLAVAVTIVAISAAARLGVGRDSPNADKAATWSALLAAALLTNPMMGTPEVNGELLAAPFIATGVAFLLAAVRASARGAARRPSNFAMLAGAGGACAALVKQNMLDVFVLAVALLPLMAMQRRLSPRAALRILGAGLFGAALSGSLAVLFAMWRGTSLSELFYAMYPFRVAAADAVAHLGGAGYAADRLHSMLVVGVIAGLIPLLAAAAAYVVIKRRRDVLAWALLVQLAYVTFSVGYGGAYWTHYLIQAVVPLSLLTGLLIARGIGRFRLFGAYVALVAVASLAFDAADIAHPNSGHVVGAAIKQVAHPTDSIVTIYGHPEVNQAAALGSPYQQLWSLPTRVLDPQLEELSAVMRGPQAPTWFVVWHSESTWGIDSTLMSQALATRYHPVSDVCGHRIYLLKGTDRTAPIATCTSAPTNPFDSMIRRNP